MSIVEFKKQPCRFVKFKHQNPFDLIIIFITETHDEIEKNSTNKHLPPDPLPLDMLDGPRSQRMVITNKYAVKCQV